MFQRHPSLPTHLKRARAVPSRPPSRLCTVSVRSDSTAAEASGSGGPPACCPCCESSACSSCARAAHALAHTTSVSSVIESGEGGGQGKNE